MDDRVDALTVNEERLSDDEVRSISGGIDRGGPLPAQQIPPKQDMPEDVTIAAALKDIVVKPV